MNTNRMSQIIESLNGLGTKQNTMYTNQEIIDHLTELQGAMARGVFEKTHAENLRDQDIVIHFEALAREYGLDNSDTYLRFKENWPILLVFTAAIGYLFYVLFTLLFLQYGYALFYHSKE